MPDPQNLERLPFFGVVPSGWSCRRVEHLAEYRSLSVNSNQLQDGPVLLYSIPVLQETGQPERVPVGDIGSEKIPLTGGEVLVSRLNPRKGLVIQVPPSNSDRMLASSEFVPLRPVCMDERYLYYVMASEPFIRLLDSAVESVTRSHKRVRPWQILKARIPVPSEGEQQRLVRFLDHETAHIDRLIEKKERLISLLEEKRSALITHAVTKGLDPDVPMKDSGVEWIGEIPEHWSLTRLKRVGWLRGGVGFPEKAQGLSGEELPFYKVSDMILPWNELYLRASNHTVSRELSRSLGATVFPAEAVVFPKVGAALLKNRRRILSGPSCVDNNMMVFVPEGCSAKWAFYWFTLLDLIPVANPGAVPSVTESQVAELPALVPPLSEQERICSSLERREGGISSVLARIREGIELLEERRSALITAAVTGQIDPDSYEGWADAADPEPSSSDIDCELESQHA